MPATKPSACAQCAAKSWRRVVHHAVGVTLIPEQRIELADDGGGESDEQPAAIGPSSPHWQCKKCAYRAGQPVAWTGSNGPADGDFADFHAAIELADVPDVDASPAELEAFALAFDGWAAFGHRQSGVLARRTREDFVNRGVLPRTLALLRNTLFDEQVIRHRAPDGELLVALLDAIRAELAPERRTSGQLVQR